MQARGVEGMGTEVILLGSTESHPHTPLGKPGDTSKLPAQSGKEVPQSWTPGPEEHRRGGALQRHVGFGTKGPGRSGGLHKEEGCSAVSGR